MLFDFSSLPEDQIMNALFETDFVPEYSDEVTIISSKKINKKEKPKNRKYLASQKYKIKDKRILWAKARNEEDSLDSRFVKNGIFSAEPIMEVSFMQSTLVEKDIVYEPFLCSLPFSISPFFKFKGFPFDTFSSKELKSLEFSSRIVFIAKYSSTEFFVDYETKKAFQKPCYFSVIKKLPFLNFSSKEQTREYFPSFKTEAAFRCNYFFYGKKVKSSFVNNIYLWGSLGRNSRDFYDWSVLPKVIERKARLKYDLLDGLSEYDRRLEQQAYGFDTCDDLYPPEWERALSEYSDEFVNEVSVEKYSEPKFYWDRDMSPFYDDKTLVFK